MSSVDESEYPRRIPNDWTNEWRSEVEQDKKCVMGCICPRPPAASRTLSRCWTKTAPSSTVRSIRAPRPSSQWDKNEVKRCIAPGVAERDGGAFGTPCPEARASAVDDAGTGGRVDGSRGVWSDSAGEEAVLVTRMTWLAVVIEAGALTVREDHDY